jgi:hypothetical protein
LCRTFARERIWVKVRHTGCPRSFLVEPSAYLPLGQASLHLSSDRREGFHSSQKTPLSTTMEACPAWAAEFLWHARHGAWEHRDARAIFPLFNASISGGERLPGSQWLCCSLFAPSAHSWPENLLALRLIYQVENMVHCHCCVNKRGGT